MSADVRTSFGKLRCLFSTLLALSILVAAPGARAVREADMIPVHLSLSVGVMIGGENAELGVTVSSVPASGGCVQILCSSPEALNSPNGKWPFQLGYAAGSPITQSFAITANDVLLPEIVTIYMGNADADPGDLSQWTAAGVILVLPEL